MNRRVCRTWAFWLLPILAARALLPVGFMVSADADGLHIAFCPTQSPALVEAFADQSAKNHPAQQPDHSLHHAPVSLAHAHGSSASAGDATFDPPCPYALAAVAVDADIPRLAARPPFLADEIVVGGEVHASITGPLRSDRIRGPPSFS